MKQGTVSINELKRQLKGKIRRHRGIITSHEQSLVVNNGSGIPDPTDLGKVTEESLISNGCIELMTKTLEEEEQTLLALALADLEIPVCKVCGTPFSWERFVAAQRLLCFDCAEKEVSPNGRRY